MHEHLHVHVQQQHHEHKNALHYLTYNQQKIRFDENDDDFERELFVEDTCSYGRDEDTGELLS